MNFRHDTPTVEMLVAERLERDPYGIYVHAGYEIATQFGGAETYDDIGFLAYTLALGRAMHAAEHPGLPALEYALKPHPGSSPDGGAERTRPASAQDIGRITALYNDETMVAWSERTAAKAMIALQEAKSSLSQDKEWIATCAALLNKQRERY